MSKAILILFLLGLVPQKEAVEPKQEPEPFRVDFVERLAKEEVEKTLEDHAPEPKVDDTVQEVVEEETLPEVQQVRYTVYYPQDSTGTGTTTSIGINVDSLETGPYGLRMLDGRAVVATATFGCLNSPSDECGAQRNLPLQDEYHVFQEGQELTLVILDNGQEVRVPAVVGDACGACFWNEDKQRVDLLVWYTSEFRFEGWIEYEK